MCNILAKCRPGLQNRQTDRQTDDVCVHANAIQRKRGKGKGRGLREVSQLQLLFCNNVLNLCQAAPKKKQQATASETKGRREEGKRGPIHTQRYSYRYKHTHRHNRSSEQTFESNYATGETSPTLTVRVYVCVCARTCD